MAYFTLEQIDHALEWALRRAVTADGHWPDIEALLLADPGGTDAAAYAAARQAILNAGRELVEVVGVGGYDDRQELRGNNVIVSRLPTSMGSYATGSLAAFEPVDAEDLSRGYTKLRLPAHPHNVGYEVRYVSDSSRMDRYITALILQVFGQAIYCHGLNDDLSLTAAGFWVVPVGDAIDLGTKDFTERAWRLQVQDVHLIRSTVLGAVPAATDLGVDLSAAADEEPLRVSYPAES